MRLRCILPFIFVVAFIYHIGYERGYWNLKTLEEQKYICEHDIKYKGAYDDCSDAYTNRSTVLIDW